MTDLAIAASSDDPAAEADDADLGSDGTAARETKGERTRRRLLEIAIERFGERGYRATSVSEIARAAGLTQAAVYAYFESKEALFDAAVDTDAESSIETTVSRAADAPANQLVPLLLFFFMADLDQHPLLRRVLGGMEPDALKRLVNLPALLHLTGVIRDRVAEAQTSGEVRTDLDPAMFANGAETILLSLLMSITQVGQSTETRRQLGVVAIFDTALRPATPS